MEDMKFRKLTKKDVELLIPVYIDYAKHTYTFYDFNPKSYRPRSGLIKLLSKKNHKYFGVFDNKELIAFTNISIEKKFEKIIFINDFFVKPEYRKKGIGKKLLREVKKWAKSKKIKELHLGTSVRNKQAISAWKKHGFTEFELFFKKKI